MQVQYEGKTYEVTFEGQWHNPPLDGAINPQRIKHTTRCEIRLPEPIGVGADTVAFTGYANCSIVDRFNYMAGCRKALARAVFELLTADQGADLRGDTLGEAQHEFEKQVMPLLAQAQAERRAALPKDQRRRRQGRRAALRAFDGLAESAALAIVALREGAETAFMRYGRMKMDEVAADAHALAQREKKLTGAHQ